MIVFAVVAAAAAAPQGQDQPQVNILSQTFDQDEQGNYQYAYELDNGQKVYCTSSENIVKMTDE